MKRIRALRWLAMALRAQETAQVRSDALKGVQSVAKSVQRVPCLWALSVP